MHKVLESNEYLNFIETNDSMQSLLELLISINNANPLLDGLCYFRFYNQQQYFGISTQQKWFRNFLIFNDYDETIFERKIREASKTHSPVYAAWNYLSNDKLLTLGHSYDINIGFDIYKRRKEYVELMGFYGEGINYNFHDYCLNNLDFLYKSLKTVEEKFEKITEIYTNISPLKIEIPKKIPYITESGEKFLFSRREIECIKYLLKGYTMKGIGQELNLSPRTVETYMVHIKHKLRVNYRFEIIKKLGRFSPIFPKTI